MDEQKTEGKGCGCGDKCCCCRCGKMKGILAVLLLIAVGFGLFQAGRCSAMHCQARQAAAGPVADK